MKIFNSITYLIAVSPILLVFAILIYFTQMFKPDSPLTEKDTTDCLEDIENCFRNSKLDTIDFSSTIKCFEWDKILITSNRSNGDKKNKLEYTVIGHINEKKESSSYNDWLDGDRNWWYIFFYKKNESRPSNALIVANTVFIYNDTVTELRKSESKFLITKGDTSGYFRKLNVIR
jgi:hypothetical protein